MIKLDKGISTPLVITTIVILVIALGALGYQYYRLPKEETKISEGRAKDEIAGWKTYRNDNLGFEFKYPKDFISFEPSKYQADDFIFMVCNPDKSFCLLANVTRIKQRSFEDYANLWKKVNSDTITTSYFTNISEKKAFISEGTERGKSVIYTLIDFAYPIGIYFKSGSDTGKDLEFVKKNNNQILSTFRLID